MPLENIKNSNYSEDSFIQEDSHVINFWQPFNINIDENFTFVHNSLLFNTFSNLLYLIATPILYVICKLFFGFRIYGKENLDFSGARITVSNHVHYLDCVMNAFANIPRKTYFTSLESNFNIPVVRHIIKLLNAIPVPEDIKYTHNFMNAIDNLLKENKTVHFYPEGSLWPYSTKIRNFKSGAFSFAVRNNVPIVPFVYKFDNSHSILSIFKKKPCISLHILPPQYPNTELSKKESIQDLKNRVYENMNKENKNEEI